MATKSRLGPCRQHRPVSTALLTVWSSRKELSGLVTRPSETPRQPAHGLRSAKGRPFRGMATRATESTRENWRSYAPINSGRSTRASRGYAELSTITENATRVMSRIKASIAAWPLHCTKFGREQFFLAKAARTSATSAVSQSCQPPPIRTETRQTRPGHRRSQEAVLLTYSFNTRG